MRMNRIVRHVARNNNTIMKMIESHYINESICQINTYIISYYGKAKCGGDNDVIAAEV